ncbi:low-complexity protein [Leptolyngbya sp. 'hensonii']|nr:low-complexity protein [Leptolyngbya sp. 'hensonii']
MPPTEGNPTGNGVGPGGTTPPESGPLAHRSPNIQPVTPVPANPQSANSADSPLNNPIMVTLTAFAILVLGLITGIDWLQIAGTIMTLFTSIRLGWPAFKPILQEMVSEKEQPLIIAAIGLILTLIGFLQIVGVNQALIAWLSQPDWDALGALGEIFGALGQILIAVLAVYIAWRQYVISKDLTIQQNTITQQQTIDAYFQGVSDLVLDEEGLLEDWPQERAIAEGRTAAILASVNAEGKAKVIRFLSRAKMLTPLRRDRRLGRAILDGIGGYEEDRLHGVRVIDLGVMLARSDLSDTDLRWTDLSEANLVKANLARCDLVKANFSRTILYGANLQNTDLEGVRFFYGRLEKASPRSRTEPPDYTTGVHTGAVVENADFTDAEDLGDEQRYYLCAWGGTKTRGTIPGGCQGIPNLLGR